MYNLKQIKISSAMFKQKFIPCEHDYIINNCKGRCCEGAKGIKVCIHQSEEDKYILLGAKIKNGFIVPDNRGLCPFKDDTGLCKVHNNKPFGCRFSPFLLTNKDTLVVRNRYRLLRCYKNTTNNIKTPVYKAHRWSLIQIIGIAFTNKITERLDSGAKDQKVLITENTYNLLKYFSNVSKNK